MMQVSLRAVALALALSVSAIPALAAEASGDPVVAIVNGKEIRRSAVMELKETLPQLRTVPVELVYEQLLDHLINGQILTAEAQKQKLQDDPQVKQRLKELETRLMQEAYLTRRVETELTDAVVKKRFEEHVKANPPQDEVRARHILLDSEEAAKAVIAELGKGAKFEDVAKAKSTGPSAENGGDLGYFAKSDMVPEFAEAAFAMKPGEVSKAPVKTQFGWHVIKVEDRRMSEAPQYDEVKDQLKAEMAEETVQKVVRGLRDKAEVKRFQIDGSPIAAAPAEKPKQ